MGLPIPLTQLGDRARHRAREGRSRSNGGRFPRVQLRQGNRQIDGILRAGNQSRPARVAHQPKASLAWRAGDRRCEA